MFPLAPENTAANGVTLSLSGMSNAEGSLSENEIFKISPSCKHITFSTQAGISCFEQTISNWHFQTFHQYQLKTRLVLEADIFLQRKHWIGKWLNLLQVSVQGPGPISHSPTFRVAKGSSIGNFIFVSKVQQKYAHDIKNSFLHSTILQNLPKNLAPLPGSINLTFVQQHNFTTC